MSPSKELSRHISSRSRFVRKDILPKEEVGQSKERERVEYLTWHHVEIFMLFHMSTGAHLQSGDSGSYLHSVGFG